MTKKHQLEFANFILRFGDNRVLLDLAEEIVIPAFTSENLGRSYSETRHFFHDVEILNFGDDDTPILCIAGRYIKDTLVRREQVFREETDQLVRDSESLKTSPSAIFMLILNNHRLMYFKETSYAPNILSFKATIINFLKLKYHEFVDRLHEESGVSKSQLYREYEPPNLEIVPLLHTESIGDFVRQYEKLRTVEIQLLSTNNELDNNGFFEQARQAKDEVQSSITTITHNNGKNGLLKGAVISQLESALRIGNSKVKLKGKDAQGNKLEGNNESLKIKADLAEVPQTIRGIAFRSFNTFQDFLDRGIIHIGQAREDLTEKIREIHRRRNQSNQDDE
jgi:hypothetical protein